MKYIASCSFGKDSIATILLALEHNEPLDAAVWSEVMFSHELNITGEVPEHAEWIYETAIPKLNSLGVRVDVVRGKKDYVSLFKQKITRGKRKGMIVGFPLGGMCVVNASIKIEAIRRYNKAIQDDITQYVGIAVDEPERLERLNGNKTSLLAKYGYTEAMAKEKCKEYGLLSPIYQRDTRGGGVGFVRTANTRHSRGSSRNVQTYGNGFWTWERHRTFAHMGSSTGKQWNR